MLIAINGRREETPAATISAFVRSRGLNPERLVVELNRRIVPQSEWEMVELRPDDCIELLSFVGGG